VSINSDQRLENKPGESGASSMSGGGIAGHGPPPRIAKPRFPPTMLEMPPPAHEPGLPPLVALPFGPPPPIAEPRFPDTLIDLDPPTEERHALESAPETTRTAAEIAPKSGRSDVAEEAVVSDPAPTVRSKSDVRFFSPEDQGRWLDGYELITEIASGGMATVFLARRKGAGGFQRLVAIKRLHPELEAEPELAEMFLEEARIAAQIHHAHAVPILEIGKSARGYYLVMEYVEGVTLAQLVERAEQKGIAIPRPVAIRILLDALSGLHAAHELEDENGEPLGTVHRDVSPQNILVGIDGAARLTDFGVARTAAHPASAKIETVKGRVEYMAPEQIRQEAVDRRADLFAMGVILWEVLAGRPLFRGETRFDTIVRALNAPVPRLRDKVTGVSDELDDLSTRALARPPSERFQSAVEMAEAIEQVAKGSIAASREVAALVIALFGQELDQRRADVRSWLDEGPIAATPLPPPLAPEPEAPIADVVTEPEGAAAEASADAHEPPESVTVARPRLESLAPTPREESDPITTATATATELSSPGPSATAIELSSPRPSLARRALTLGAGLAVMALGALGALLSRPTATATATPLPAIVATVATTATTATTAATMATAVTAAATTASASAAEVPAAAPSEAAAPLAAPLAPARAAAPSSNVKPAAPAPGKGLGEDLENPYR
jgi:eukaryotic-like serine/threonine-protein kinase